MGRQLPIIHSGTLLRSKQNFPLLHCVFYWVGDVLRDALPRLRIDCLSLQLLYLNESEAWQA